MTLPDVPKPAPGVTATEVPVQPGETAQPLCWRSEQLLGGAREARIEHQGAVYRLQLTSLGKLILTK